jgi:hypothetical protein
VASHGQRRKDVASGASASKEYAQVRQGKSFQEGELSESESFASYSRNITNLSTSSNDKKISPHNMAKIEIDLPCLDNRFGIDSPAIQLGSKGLMKDANIINPSKTKRNFA